MEVTLMRSFYVKNVEYQLLNDKKHLIVRRTPGENSEDHYRWAVKTNGGWKVYIGKEYQMCIGGVYERLTPEVVARKLYAGDNEKQ